MPDLTVAYSISSERFRESSSVELVPSAFWFRTAPHVNSCNFFVLSYLKGYGAAHSSETEIPNSFRNLMHRCRNCESFGLWRRGGLVYRCQRFGGTIFRVVPHGVMSQKTGIIIKISVKTSNLTYLQTLTKGLHILILRLRSRTRHLWQNFPLFVESGLWVPCSYVQQYSSYFTFKCRVWEKVPPYIIDLLSHFRWSNTPMQFKHVIMLIKLSVRVLGGGGVVWPRPRSATLKVATGNFCASLNLIKCH